MQQRWGCQCLGWRWTRKWRFLCLSRLIWNPFWGEVRRYSVRIVYVLKLYKVYLVIIEFIITQRHGVKLLGQWAGPRRSTNMVLNHTRAWAVLDVAGKGGARVGISEGIWDRLRSFRLGSRSVSSRWLWSNWHWWGLIQLTLIEDSQLPEGTFLIYYRIDRHLDIFGVIIFYFWAAWSFESCWWVKFSGSFSVESWKLEVKLALCLQTDFSTTKWVYKIGLQSGSRPRIHT